jgi:hypothetical protein
MGIDSNISEEDSTGKDFMHLVFQDLFFRA